MSNSAGFSLFLAAEKRKVNVKKKKKKPNPNGGYAHVSKFVYRT